jgi:dihydrolipoamide dehydrogenase
MPGCDADLVRPLQKRIASRYEHIWLDTKVVGIEPRSAGLEVLFEGAKAPPPQVYDKVLVAVGRTPNGKTVAAEAAGVNVDARGYIAVDREVRTTLRTFTRSATSWVSRCSPTRRRTRVRSRQK